MQEIGQAIMKKVDQKKINEVCKKLERKEENSLWKWDAEFWAFGKLTGLVTDYFLIPGKQLTAEQADALHRYAEVMARDLTSGQYEFNEKEA